MIREWMGGGGKYGRWSVCDVRRPTEIVSKGKEGELEENTINNVTPLACHASDCTPCCYLYHDLMTH